MLEAGSSDDTNQNSVRQEVESEINMSNPSNQESREVNMLIKKRIDELESEINKYSARVAENERKLENIKRETDKDRLKLIELKKNLDNIIKAQSLLEDTYTENTSENITQENVESPATNQESVNTNVNLSSTRRDCNHNRNSVRAEQLESQLEFTERTGQNNDNLDNIDYEVQSQDHSDNTSVSSYRPSVHTESTETQSMEQVSVSKIRLPWDIDCQKLLHALRDHEDSYHFREPVDLEKYDDYRKYVTAPMSLRDIEETFQSGEYKSPLQFSKDVNLIFENSRKYNIDKSSLIYRQTTRLKKFYKDEMEQIISNWKASKKSKGSPSKRKIRGPDNESSDEDNDSQSRLQRQRKKRKNILSDDDDTTSKNASTIDEIDADDDECDDDDDQPTRTIRTRSKAARNNSRVMQDEAITSEDDDDSFIESDDEDLSTAYEDDSTSSNEENEDGRNENQNIHLASLTSDNSIKNYSYGDWVTVKGKVFKVFKTVKQRSNEMNRNFKLFKFLLQTKEGSHVECVAWEDIAIKCQSKIRRNQVITLANVKVKSCIGKSFNRGNFELQLILYSSTSIELH